MSESAYRFSHECIDASWQAGSVLHTIIRTRIGEVERGHPLCARLELATPKEHNCTDTPNLNYQTTVVLLFENVVLPLSGVVSLAARRYTSM